MARIRARSSTVDEYAIVEGGRVVPLNIANPDDILYCCRVGDKSWIKVRDRVLPEAVARIDRCDDDDDDDLRQGTLDCIDDDCYEEYR